MSLGDPQKSRCSKCNSLKPNIFSLTAILSFDGHKQTRQAASNNLEKNTSEDTISNKKRAIK